VSVENIPEIFTGYERKMAGMSSFRPLTRLGPVPRKKITNGPERYHRDTETTETHRISYKLLGDLGGLGVSVVNWEVG
jgi:hypothetical protein